MNTVLPVDCATKITNANIIGNKGCHVPLAPAVVKMMACDHYFHEVCIDTWVVNQKSCPTCNKGSPNKLHAPTTSSPPTNCCICELPLKPIIVLLPCNDGFHQSCYENIFTTEKFAQDNFKKCHREHAIDHGQRKVYTPEEYSSLLSPKTPPPVYYTPPSPKEEITEKSPEQRTWKSISWGLTKAALAAAIAYKTSRWFF